MDFLTPDYQHYSGSPTGGQPEGLDKLDTGRWSDSGLPGSSALPMNFVEELATPEYRKYPLPAASTAPGAETPPVSASPPSSTEKTPAVTPPSTPPGLSSYVPPGAIVMSSAMLGTMPNPIPGGPPVAFVFSPAPATIPGTSPATSAPMQQRSYSYNPSFDGNGNGDLSQGAPSSAAKKGGVAVADTIAHEAAPVSFVVPDGAARVDVVLGRVEVVGGVPDKQVPDPSVFMLDKIQIRTHRGEDISDDPRVTSGDVVHVAVRWRAPKGTRVEANRLCVPVRATFSSSSVGAGQGGDVDQR